MKYLADESVDFPIVKSLRDQGFEVDYITEISPGIPDDEVIQMAIKSSAILITGDKDFGALTFRKKIISQGIILYRLAGLNNLEKANHVITVIKDNLDSLRGSFTVIGKALTRIRKLPEK